MSIVNLTLTGYTKFANGTASRSIGSYELPVNPDTFDLSYELNGDDSESEEQPLTAAGTSVKAKPKTYNPRTISFDFIIDNSGAIPFAPPTQSSTLSVGSSIEDSLIYLRKLTIKPNSDSHRPPYVKLEWGTITLVGNVTKFESHILKFKRSGSPLRAKISMSIKEEVDEAVITREFRSPDITRMPTIKEGDSLVSLCEQFYDDPKYFIRIAEYNELPSFRSLKPGSVLEFPPLEK
jgi:hypothetical protein